MSATLSQGIWGVNARTDTFAFGRIMRDLPLSAAGRAIAERCLHELSSERPTAAELLEDPFFAADASVAELVADFEAAVSALSNDLAHANANTNAFFGFL